MTRSKKDTHRGTGKKLYPLKESDGTFEKIQRIVEKQKEKEADEEIKNYIPNRKS